MLAPDGIPALVEEILIMKPHGHQQMRPTLAQLLRVALLTPQIQAVDLARNILYGVCVGLTRGAQLLAALALQHALQGQVAVHRHTKDEVHRPLGDNGVNAFPRKPGHKKAGQYVDKGNDRHGKIAERIGKQRF